MLAQSQDLCCCPGWPQFALAYLLQGLEQDLAEAELEGLSPVPTKIQAVHAAAAKKAAGADGRRAQKLELQEQELELQELERMLAA
jgi:hypothetical protein